MPYFKESSINNRPFTAKVWGSEEEIVSNSRYTGKILHLDEGFQSSLHYHPIKHETFLAVQGVVRLELGGEVLWLRGAAREAVEVPSGIPHRFRAVGGPAVVVEFSSPHSDEDVVRLEESGALGRAEREFDH